MRVLYFIQHGFHEQFRFRISFRANLGYFLYESVLPRLLIARVSSNRVDCAIARAHTHIRIVSIGVRKLGRIDLILKHKLTLTILDLNQWRGMRILNNGQRLIAYQCQDFGLLFQRISLICQ